MKVAIYARVSTGKQDFENQLIQLKEYCKSREHEIVEIYKETISGKEVDRPEFKRMMTDATKRKFEAVLVWALDRFTREGTTKVHYYMNTLNQHKVSFLSYQEPHLNTDNELARDIILTVMGSMAKQESIRISNRTKAGLERARREGKILGRPKISKYHINKILKMKLEGLSAKRISKELRVGYGTVWRVIQNTHGKSIPENDENKVGS